MTPTTAQIMTENTVSQTYRATYSPDDNKLRLYASLRLDEETYSLINKAGFRALLQIVGGDKLIIPFC